MVTVYLEKKGRKPAVPLAALILGIVWFSFVVTGVILSQRLNIRMDLCLFKRLTGIPCPTCGATRGGMLILHGHFFRGWLENPFVYTVVPIIGLHLLFQLITGYTVRYRYTKSGRRIVSIILIVLILLNWGYVIMRDITVLH